MDTILTKVYKVQTLCLKEKVSSGVIKGLLEIFEDLKILSRQIVTEFMNDILEERGSCYLLQGNSFKETRQEIKDVIGDEEIDPILVLQVIFFISIFWIYGNSKNIPLVDANPVQSGITVCFPGGLLNILFTKRGLIMYEAASKEAAKNANFEYFTLSQEDPDTIERFSVALQQYNQKL